MYRANRTPWSRHIQTRQPAGGIPVLTLVVYPKVTPVLGGIAKVQHEGRSGRRLWNWRGDIITRSWRAICAVRSAVGIFRRPVTDQNLAVGITVHGLQLAVLIKASLVRVLIGSGHELTVDLQVYGPFTHTHTITWGGLLSHRTGSSRESCPGCRKRWSMLRDCRYADPTD